MKQEGQRGKTETDAAGWKNPRNIKVKGNTNEQEMVQFNGVAAGSCGSEL